MADQPEAAAMRAGSRSAKLAKAAIKAERAAIKPEKAVTRAAMAEGPVTRSRALKRADPLLPDLPESGKGRCVFKFGKEVARLISKMRSFPDNAKVKEVEQMFLLELLSNACIALQLRRSDILVDGTDVGELRINIVADKINGSLSIIDNGIGMNKDELVQYLGDKPKYAYETYVYNLNQYDTSKPLVNHGCNVYGYNDFHHFCGISPNSPKSTLGFHSVFMVADKVVVTTKTARGKTWVWMWDSDSGSDGYTIAEAEAEETEVGRAGTKVTLFLNKKHRHFSYHDLLYPLISRCVNLLVYPLYISFDPMQEPTHVIYDMKRQEEGEGRDLKLKFNAIRRKFEEVLGSRVEKVVLVEDPRCVPEFASYLSPDRKTFYINPRNPLWDEEMNGGFDGNITEDVVELHFQGCLTRIFIYDIEYGTSFYHSSDLDKAKRKREEDVDKDSMFDHEKARRAVLAKFRAKDV